MTDSHKETILFQVKEYSPDDYPYLLDMYDNFSPKASFQGMPPCNHGTCSLWLRRITDEGQNFVAWHEGKVIGHGALLPEFDRQDAEYLVFVAQDHRGKGVGNAITKRAIEWSRGHGLKLLWLTVDTYNFRAIRLYKRHGFYFADPFDCSPERLMILDLTNS